MISFAALSFISLPSLDPSPTQEISDSSYLRRTSSSPFSLTLNENSPINRNSDFGVISLVQHGHDGVIVAAHLDLFLFSIFFGSLVTWQVLTWWSVGFD
ncbi:hypothetical protein RchiOBHm_Chr2g0105451 [Rosa chinensis]|uniref:Uncharacterized protein n=1 Tax=Rosa chinensis TaxID=74649 RepID=A0A2P6RNF5_ROSCH|nr:hypothetical protein RchiOBHm_Chr2g0105451 [Rosa chinensis]